MTLVYIKVVTTHAEHLREVFQVLGENHLVVNKKCDFAVANVEYLDHIVFAQGVSADPQKLSAMTD